MLCLTYSGLVTVVGLTTLLPQAGISAYHILAMQTCKHANIQSQTHPERYINRRIHTFINIPSTSSIHLIDPTHITLTLLVSPLTLFKCKLPHLDVPAMSLWETTQVRAPTIWCHFQIFQSMNSLLKSIILLLYIHCRLQGSTSCGSGMPYRGRTFRQRALRSFDSFDDRCIPARLIWINNT